MRAGKRRGSRYSGIEQIRGELGVKEALRRLTAHLVPLKASIILGLVFTVAWTSVNLGYGKLVMDFLDTLKLNAGSGDMRTVNSFTAYAFFLFALRGFVSFGMNYSWSYTAHRLTMRLRNEVYRHLQRLSISFFEQRRSGQLLSVLSNDVPSVTSVLDALQDSINAPLTLIGGIVLLFWINWRLALLSCVCLLPTVWVILQATRRINKLTAQLQSNRARVVDLAAETISAVRIVKSFNNEDYEIGRFFDRSRSVFQSLLRTSRLKMAMRPLVEILGQIAIILVLWVGAWEIIHYPGRLSLGGLTWFVLVLKQVGDGARNFGNIMVNLTEAGVSADRVFTLLNIRSDIEEKPDSIELKNVQGRVTFENVDFAYSSGIPVLANISFEMDPGKVVAIVGPTGAGKTTIASMIPRFYDVGAGSIKVDGVDIRDCTLNSLRTQIGIVPQDTILFAGTLRDNIAYGRLDASEEEIEQAARMANAWEFVEKLPQGLQTVVGERGTMLSGGQRQRIAIARAILRNPRILILDEATSSLDTQSEALVQDALQKLVADRTTLVIAHRLSTIRNADRILVMKDGRVVESGAHDELLAHGGVYTQLYRKQFRGDEAEPEHGLLD